MTKNRLEKEGDYCSYIGECTAILETLNNSKQIGGINVQSNQDECPEPAA